MSTFWLNVLRKSMNFFPKSFTYSNSDIFNMAKKGVPIWGVTIMSGYSIFTFLNANLIQLMARDFLHPNSRL